jgi:hypothetical protein
VEGPFVDRLVRFDPFGELLWSTEVRADPKDIFSSAGSLEHLAGLADGSILTAGTAAVGEGNCVGCRDFLSTARVSDNVPWRENTELALDPPYHPIPVGAGCLAGRRRFFFGQEPGSLMAGMF